ncbi:hypothetical protein [Burkholderia sp. JKS000303]|uniref:hypothetical protein n=1 Tax=Burkholderia sp. JKS000303 TaxID=1938747 RepID=UPI00117F942D|nr:hypothetical protein [Burkholderia sp. JKS000303]
MAGSMLRIPLHLTLNAFSLRKKMVPPTERGSTAFSGLGNWQPFSTRSLAGDVKVAYIRRWRAHSSFSFNSRIVLRLKEISFETIAPPVIPYFVRDIHVTNENIQSIRSWYETTESCDKPHRDRIEKAANFLNRGLNAEDIEAYINYFVTLDALFGRRGSVEDSILHGVKSLQLDGPFAEKAQWLFELRNEIVHGGSRHLSEWPKYSRYTQHFRSKPMHDVRVLAQRAVLGAPYLFSS